MATLTLEPPELVVRDTAAWRRWLGAHHAQPAQIDGIKAGIALGGIAGVRAVARGVASADRGKFEDGIADIHMPVACAMASIK